MSAESWLAAYYPVSADDVPIEDALDHSIRKWTGLLPENIAAHDIQEYDDLPMYIDANSCALCFHAKELALDGDEANNPDVFCRRCPLYISRGQRCDRYSVAEYDAGTPNPWFAWSNARDPRLMLDALLKAKADGVVFNTDSDFNA